MKVTSGKLKFKNIFVLKKSVLRPTSLKVRLAIFNILIHRFKWKDWSESASILEPYAGTGSVSIEAPALGTKDYFAAALTEGSLGNLQFLHGTTAGNKVQFISSKVDIGDVAYSDMQGVVMLDIPFTLVPSASSTAAEGDEFSLIYT